MKSANCSLCWREKNLRSTRTGAIREGDICQTHASLFEPFLEMLVKRSKAPVDSRSIMSRQSRKNRIKHESIMEKLARYLDAAEGKTRPCIVASRSQQGTARLFIMCSLERNVNDTGPLPDAFARFTVPVYTTDLANINSDHLHTSPEWRRGPQWIVTISIERRIPSSDERWWCGPYDSKAGYYLPDAALDELEQLGAEQKRAFDLAMVSSRADPLGEYRREMIRLYEVTRASFSIVYAEPLSSDQNRSNPGTGPSIVSKPRSRGRANSVPLSGTHHNLVSKSRNGSRTSISSVSRLLEISFPISSSVSFCYQGKLAASKKMASSRKDSENVSNHIQSRQPASGVSADSSMDSSWTLVGPGGRHGHRH